MSDNAKLVAEIDRLLADDEMRDELWIELAEIILRNCRAALSLPAPQGAVEVDRLRKLLLRWMQFYNLCNKDRGTVADMIALRKESHAALSAAPAEGQTPPAAPSQGEPSPQTPAETEAQDTIEYLMNVSIEDLHDYAAVKVGQRLGLAADLIERQQARIAELEAQVDSLDEQLAGERP